MLGRCQRERKGHEVSVHSSHGWRRAYSVPPSILFCLAASGCLSACPVSQAGRDAVTRPEPPALTVPPLDQVIRDARAEGEAPATTYQAPPSPARATLRTFAAVTARGANASAPRAFEVIRYDLDAGLVVLRGTELGAGVYALRTREARPVLVIVPHSFWDTHTLLIGRALFDSLAARALLVNTIHRYRGARCALPGADDVEKDEYCASDMAHAPDSYFQAVHEGLHSAFPDALTLAVHGFRRAEREPDVILSAAGTDTDLAPFLRTLTALYGAERVRAFPDQIGRLGGTTSVQARYLRRSGGHMVHVELSRELRDRLQADPAQLSRFARAFADALAPAQPRLQVAPER